MAEWLEGLLYVTILKAAGINNWGRHTVQITILNIKKLLGL